VKNYVFSLIDSIELALRHLAGEKSSHVMRHGAGELVYSSRGPAQVLG